MAILRITLDNLFNLIAEGIKENAKAYEVPAVCVRVGIQTHIDEDDADEARTTMPTLHSACMVTACGPT